MLLKGATHNLVVRTRTEIALYLLNQKRAHLRSLEERFRIVILVNADATIGGQVSFMIDKGDQVHTPEQARALALQSPAPAVETEVEEDIVLDEAEPEDEDSRTKSRRTTKRYPNPKATWQRPPPRNGPRARTATAASGVAAAADGGGERRDEGAQAAHEPSADHPIAPSGEDDDSATGADAEAGETVAEASENGVEANGAETNGDGERRRRRRGRRGGRRNRRERDGEAVAGSENGHAGESETDAVTAFDASPVESAEDATSPAPSPMPASSASYEPAAEHRYEPTPPPAPAAEAPSAAPAPEAPRRRSTVREPVPVAAFAGAGIPDPVVSTAPAVAPPVIVTSTAEEDRPRRSGWWAKRALGKD